MRIPRQDWYAVGHANGFPGAPEKLAFPPFQKSPPYNVEPHITCYQIRPDLGPSTRSMLVRKKTCGANKRLLKPIERHNL